MYKLGLLLVAASAAASSVRSADQFMIQATVHTGNGEKQVLYLGNNQLGPKESGNYYQWSDSNKIAKAGTDYCLQLQSGGHQGCAGPVWTCNGWQYLGTENFRGYETCQDSDTKWETVVSTQTTGSTEEPVVLLKEVTSGMCAFLDTYHSDEETVQYLGLGDCNASNRAQVVLTVNN